MWRKLLWPIVVIIVVVPILSSIEQLIYPAYWYYNAATDSFSYKTETVGRSDYRITPILGCGSSYADHHRDNLRLYRSQCLLQRRNCSYPLSGSSPLLRQ